MSDSPTSFDFDPAYRVAGYRGIAWYAVRHPFEYVLVDEDFDEWESVEDPSQVICRMVGDDRDFTFDRDDLTPISDDDYCAGCGQIGCGWC